MKLKFLKMRIEVFKISDDLGKLEYKFDYCDKLAIEKFQYFRNKLYVIEYRLQILENEILEYQFEQLVLSLMN